MGGETVTGRGFKSDPTTARQEDFRNACYLVAGVMAEFLFDGDNFRFGSSVDEVVLTKALATNVAVKSCRHPPMLWVRFSASPATFSSGTPKSFVTSLPTLNAMGPWANRVSNHSSLAFGARTHIGADSPLLFPITHDRISAPNAGDQ